MFYNDVYEVNLPPGHRFPMGKYRKVRERVQSKIAKLPMEAKDSVDCDFFVSPLSTFEELSTTHDPAYIRRFLVGDQTEREQRNVGFPWSPSGVDRALSSVGGTLAAACFVCDHQRRLQQQQQTKLGVDDVAAAADTIASTDSVPSPPPSWAAHIAGGTHHAFYDHGEGFCIFSDMAVAANVVLDRYPDVLQNNILLIDLDVHQGNGNAVLFQNNSRNEQKQKADDEIDPGQNNSNSNHQHHPSKHADRVITFSMHCSGNYFSQKQKSDLDIEMPIGCKDQAYLMTLNHWLKQFKHEHHKSSVRDDNGDSNQPKKTQTQQQKGTLSQPNYRWDLIIYQAGVDVLGDDRLGRMALSPEGVARRNELVYEFALDLGVPLVVCMGGGYPKRDDAWESIIDTHSEVYFGAHQFLSNRCGSSTDN